ncbi:MAG: transposase [Methylotetracoccus sp.]|nr:transposase [Methylotetracoccus sp.]
MWCEFFNLDHNTWSQPRLLLATETIVRLCARRWGIEPLFHNLKRWRGLSPPLAAIPPRP